jgi:hypothetical protein
MRYPDLPTAHASAETSDHRIRRSSVSRQIKTKREIPSLAALGNIRGNKRAGLVSA